MNEKKINSYIIKNFINNINKIKNRVNEFVNKNLNYNNFYVYGASTKGNVLLQYFGIDSRYIDFISDRNPKKSNCYTPGTNIKIISELKSRSLNPDSVFTSDIILSEFLAFRKDENAHCI